MFKNLLKNFKALTFMFIIRIKHDKLFYNFKSVRINLLQNEQKNIYMVFSFIKFSDEDKSYYTDKHWFKNITYLNHNQVNGFFFTPNGEKLTYENGNLLTADEAKIYQEKNELAKILTVKDNNHTKKISI